MEKIGAILLAGGTGERFGSKLPKQFVSLNGRPVLSYSVDVFQKHPKISYIIIATGNEYVNYVKKMFPNVIVVVGGKTRNDSSLNALKACDKDTTYVLIHDAVRPFVNFKMIDDCINALKAGNQAVDTIIETFDTIVSVDENRYIKEMPDRSNLYRGQTPQAFRYDVILNAYLNPEPTAIQTTDDIRVVYNKNIPCYCVNGSEYNIKITTNADLYMAERIAQAISSSYNKTHVLEGKRAVVFGAGGGIGKAVCDVMEGKDIIVHRVMRNELDFIDFDSYDNYFTELRTKVGFIDLLINAVGCFARKPLLNCDQKTINNIIDVNLKAPILLTKIAVKSILREGSMILHVGSSSWSRGRDNYSVYSASKAGLVNFIQAMSEELAPLKIKINCVNPPRTNTAMRRKNFPEEDPETLFSPTTVAQEIVKLCASNETGFVVDLKIGING